MVENKIVIEKLNLSDDAKYKLKVFGFDNLDDFNFFNLSNFSYLFSKLTDEVVDEIKRIMRHYGLPTQLDNLMFSDDTIRFLSEYQINCTADLLNANWNNLYTEIKEEHQRNQLKNALYFYKFKVSFENNFVEMVEREKIIDNTYKLSDINTGFVYPRINKLNKKISWSELYDVFANTIVFFDYQNGEFYQNPGYKIIPLFSKEIVTVNKNEIVELAWSLFLRLNKDVLENDINNHYLSILLRRKKVIFEKKMDRATKKGKVSLKRLYDIFVKTVVFFEIKEEKIEKSLFIPFLKTINIEVDELLFHPLVNECWNEFFKLNELIIKEYDLHRFSINRFYSNYDIFCERIKLTIFQRKAHKKLINSHDDNDQLFVIKMFEDKEVIDDFYILDIKTVIDLKNIEFDDFKEIFNSFNKLILLDSVLSLLVESTTKYLYNNMYELINLKKRDLVILEGRSKGVTLEQLGQQLSLTRERVRQIELKLIRKSKPILIRDMDYLKFYDQGGYYISYNNLKKIYGNMVDIFIYMSNNKYDQDLELLELDNSISKLKEIIENELGKDDREYYNQSELDEFNNYIIEKHDIFNTDYKMISFKILCGLLKRKGIYYFKSNPNLGLQYEIILKNHFFEFEGLEISTIDEFKDAFYDIFNDDSIYEKNSRSIISRVVDNKNIVLIGRGLYKYADIKEDIVSKDVLNQMYEIIRSKLQVYISYLYDRFKKQLYPQIKNRYELHSLLKITFTDLFFSKDIVGTYPNPRINFENIIVDYSLGTNGLIDLNIIKDELPEVTGAMVDIQMNEIKNMIFIGGKKYMNIDFLISNIDEFEEISKTVDEDLNNNMPVRISKLFDYFNQLAPIMVKKNKINNSFFSYNLFKYQYEDKYYFDYPYIKKHGDTSKSTNFNAVFDSLKKFNGFRISDVKKIAKDLQIVIFSMNNWLNQLYKNGYMRLNDEIVYKKEAVINDFASQLYSTRIEKLLLYYLSDNETINLNNFNYDLIPQIKKPWNKHLLAHIIINLSDSIEVLIEGNQYSNLTYRIRKKVIVNE